jgi:hypothetical protein
MAVLLALLAIGAPLAQGKIFQRHQVPGQELPEASQWLPVTIDDSSDSNIKSSPPDKLQRRHGYTSFSEEKVFTAQNLYHTSQHLAQVTAQGPYDPFYPSPLYPGSEQVNIWSPFRLL